MPTSPTEPAGPRASRGFTLLEILLVLGVLALIASVVLARLDLVTPAYRLRTAGRDLAQTVGQARSESIARAQAVELHYDLTGGTYWLSLPAEAGAAGGPNHQAPSQQAPSSFRPRELPKGVRFADCTFFRGEAIRSAAVTVRFSFLGACEGHLLHLTDGAGNAFTVEVLPLALQVNLYNSRWELADATGR
jgi:prepilin-type N-terminal cleavage/methylation domain-containing protein